MEKDTENTQGSAEIQAVLKKMRLAYVANLPQQLASISALVMELKKSEDYQISYENLYRAIHSLKGTAGTYDLPIISAICLPFDEYLTASLEGGSDAGDQQISRCLYFIDLLCRASSLAAEGRESFPEIEASLAAM